MQTNKKVTIAYSIRTTFVKRDINQVKSIGAKVYCIECPPQKTFFLFFCYKLIEVIKSFYYVLFSERLIVWFSDYHAFFPLIFSKIFLKKSLIIVGGYDAVSDPELDHGIFTKKNIRQKICKMNFCLADEIWAVDGTLVEGCPNAYQQYNINSGVIKWIPTIKNKIKVVPTTYSSEFWKRKLTKKPKTILTVANFYSSKVILLKGLPIIFLLAKKLPNYLFTIVGINKIELLNETYIPPNILLLPSQAPENLKKIYEESQFYIQASRIEGLPNSLCEAMLCESIPIGNRVFGIPKAIGDSGLIFDGIDDLNNIIRFIKGPINDLGRKARQRIINKFPEKFRTKALNEFIS
ncbi:MAG: hypothetical protein CMC79_03350 [Flavobacteriaceae bacterium]|nr:hypothetical protein [Flavobacteriaceae bacterium]|tara:strand:- start:22904 stop:23953 length:1050 start_codon:yes stop_codon:yes gene_type:complete